MNGLTVPLTDEEKLLICNELEKLYSFQDRPLPKEKKSHLVMELSTHGLPFKAIIAGIRAMFSDELKKITLADLLDSCREHIYREEIQRKECEYCHGTGSVILSGNGYEKQFACFCDNAPANLKLIRWNGDNLQIVRGVEYRIPQRFLATGGKWSQGEGV